MAASARPDYWSCEPEQWAAWVNALGFAAASKLAGACMSYFFDGELDPSVKLTKQATAIFEALRPTLDRRRSVAFAKMRTKGEHDVGRPGRNVENSDGQGKSCGKSAKNSGKVAKKSEKTSMPGTVGRRCDEDAEQTTPPAQTHERGERREVVAAGGHQKQEQKQIPPKPPAARNGTRGQGVATPSDFEEFRRLGLIDYDLPTSYGATSRMLRAV